MKKSNQTAAIAQNGINKILRRFDLEFNHQQIENLFTTPYKELKKDEIVEILALPRESLIEDFEKIIKFSFTGRCNPIDDRINRNAVDISLMFLYQLRAVESLPVLFDYLRQDVDYLYVWQNNGAMESYTWPIFAYCAMCNPREFVSFALEPNLYIWNRVVVVQSLAKVAILHPEMYSKMIELLKEVLMKYYIKHNDDSVFDNEFVSIVERDFIDMGAIELIPDIQIYHEEGLYDKSYWGNFEQIVKKIKTEQINPDAIRPRSIFYSLRSFFKHSFTDEDEEDEMLIDLLNMNSMLYSDTYNNNYEKVNNASKNEKILVYNGDDICYKDNTILGKVCVSDYTPAKYGKSSYKRNKKLKTDYEEYDELQETYMRNEYYSNFDLRDYIY